ncbi:MAG: ATP-binding cassette domain-containing protein [Candidatus Woesearchaeota archaeon]
MDIIKITNLTKKFGEFTAVNSINFEVKQGEIFGFLGPNGAGKTTTISMLATILKATSGEATVNGYDITTQQDEVRTSIGIVFQDQSLDEELTAYENMDFHGRLYHVPKEVRKDKILKLLRLVELEDRKNDLVKTFSGGMRRRLEIARGLLHEPKVLFLDEPTLGLDPQTRNHLWDYIRKLNQEQHITIILTTHYMEEADRLCNTIAIIDQGKIVTSGTPSFLKDAIGGDIITLESSDNQKLLSSLVKFKWVNKAQTHNGSLTINLKQSEKHVVDIVSLANKEKINISTLTVHKPTLEDVFLHFTGKTIREEEAGPKDAMRMQHKMWRR